MSGSVEACGAVWYDETLSGEIPSLRYLYLRANRGDSGERRENRKSQRWMLLGINKTMERGNRLALTLPTDVIISFIISSLLTSHITTVWLTRYAYVAGLYKSVLIMNGQVTCNRTVERGTQGGKPNMHENVIKQ